MVEQLPKSVTLESLALSPAELRAFPRWYTDLLLRKRTDNITIGDVMAFVDNFGLTQSDKQAITAMFGAQLVTLEPAEFYVYLRLAGHLLQGKSLRRELAFVAAPVPKPRSILSSKHSNKGARTATTPANNTNASDIDSFLSLMTGNSGGGSNGGVKKRKKRVTFDSKPPQVTEAAHRSMGELLRQSEVQNQLSLAQSSINQSTPPPPPPQPHKEPDPEPDQPIANNQFSRVNIDSVLHHGQSMLPEPPAPRKQSVKAGDSFIQQLQTSANTAQPANNTAQPLVQNSLQQPQLQQQNTAQDLQPQNTAQSLHSAPNLNSTQNLPSFMNPALRTMAGGSQQFLSPQSSGMQPQGRFLSPQASGLQQQQSTGHFLSPQASGISPQISGVSQVSRVSPQEPAQPGLPQASGLPSSMNGWQQPQKLGPQSTGSLPMSLHRPPPPPPPPPMNRFQQPQQPQTFAMHPQATGAPQQFNYQPMQPVAQPTYTGPSNYGVQPQTTENFVQPPQYNQSIQPQNTGMQFINSLTAQPSQTQYQPYNMQALRDQMPPM